MFFWGRMVIRMPGACMCLVFGNLGKYFLFDGRRSTREFLVYAFGLIFRKSNASCCGKFVCSGLNLNR